MSYNPKEAVTILDQALDHATTRKLSHEVLASVMARVRTLEVQLAQTERDCIQYEIQLQKGGYSEGN